MADPSVILPAIALKPDEKFLRIGGAQGPPLSFGGDAEIQDIYYYVDMNHFQRSRDGKPRFNGFIMANGCMVTGFVIDTTQDRSQGMALNNNMAMGFPVQPDNLQQLSDLLYGLGAIPNQVRGTGAEKVIESMKEHIKTQENQIAWLRKLLQEVIAGHVVGTPEGRTRILELEV